MPLVQSPDLGLNATVPDNQLDPRGAGIDTSNIIYRDGEIRSAFGYEKFGSGGLPLDSAILDLTQYPEIRTDTTHIVAASSGKLYKYDSVNDTWDDITRISSDNLSNINRPTSWAVIGHTDEIDSSFQHLLYCDGGLTAIQRWAGQIEANFKDLKGADGYHDPGSGLDTHFADQADIFNNHVILINAKEANSSGTLISNNQRVRWDATGELETWDGVTAGFLDLIDTGGSNIRGMKLGNKYVVYQTNSVYGLNPIGGTKVFDPEILLPDLGLLGPHLLTSTGNTHYFIGDDFNLYAFIGGSAKTRIGDNILSLFRDRINESFADRCWLTIGPENKRIWLFYVPDDKEFMTKAFALDIQQGKWMPRDFSHITEYAGNKGTPTGGGLTTAKLVGSQTFVTGDSYATAVLSGDTYADVLIDTEIARAETETSTTWNAAGTTMANGSALWDTGVNDVDPGDIIQILSGTNVVIGFYNVLSIASNTSMTLDSGISDGVGTPSNVDYDIFTPGDSYSDVLNIVFSGDKLTIGDSDGNIYQFDETLKTDDGTDIPCVHYTPEFDGAEIDKLKRWIDHHLSAKGDGVIVEYSADGGTWTDITATPQIITESYEEYEHYINNSSKRIQFRYRNDGSGSFRIREIGMSDPLIEENR